MHQCGRLKQGLFFTLPNQFILTLPLHKFESAPACWHTPFSILYSQHKLLHILQNLTVILEYPLLVTK